jgi:hypothetical protein
MQSEEDYALSLKGHFVYCCSTLLDLLLKASDDNALQGPFPNLSLRDNIHLLSVVFNAALLYALCSIFCLPEFQIKIDSALILPWSRRSIKEKSSTWTVIWQCCSPYYSFCSIFYWTSSTTTHICSYPSWINRIYQNPCSMKVSC